MNYFIDLLKGKSAAYRLSEDKYYAMIVIEKKKGFVDEVAFIRAEVEANGDDNKLDGLYVKNRIRRIKDDYNAAKMLWNELEIVLEKEKYEQRREFIDKAKSDYTKTASSNGTQDISWADIGWLCCVLLGVPLLISIVGALLNLLVNMP